MKIQKSKIQDDMISSNEILLRGAVMSLVGVLAYFSHEEERQPIVLLGFIMAFFVSIYLHRHFFPLLTAAIFAYVVASLQEYMHVQYVHNIITDTYWAVGNSLLAISFFNFGWNLIFKYKWSKNDDKH